MSFVRDALRALGIERFVLEIHDASFPADPRDDLGRGQPWSFGGREFLRSVAELGFGGIQLGPQGETSEADPSPYDAAVFSREPMSVAFAPLVEEGLLRADELADAVARRPPGSERRAAHRHVFRESRRLLRIAFERRGADPDSTADFYGAYDVLSARHGTDDWRRWPVEDRQPRPAHDPFRGFVQRVAREQHARFRAEAHRLGLVVYGDFQIGLSQRDVWAFRDALLDGLVMGAPPSRTNPEGQPWNYGVLDPESQTAVEFLRARVAWLGAQYDGIRIDHPHGLIDPWVYPAAAPDAPRAVREGARLHSSPDRVGLQRFAIARADQLDTSLPRHADGWVRTLDDEQVAGYARFFDVVAGGAREVVCEVLSTQPHPVGRVLERHGLGRFRVTQKVGLDDPRDVYRSENARPQDWIMVGNHDTEPLRAVVARWLRDGSAERHAAYLGERLRTRVEPTAEALFEAKLAELFVGPARNVMMFFADLFALDERYNRPGVVSDDNWRLRVPPHFRTHNLDHLTSALRLALKSR